MLDGAGCVVNKTRRQRELANYAEGENQPLKCRLFKHGFIKIARTLAAADVKSNEELARFFGVHPVTVGRWRDQFPAFDQAIKTGDLDAMLLCTDTVLNSVRDGNSGDAKWWMDRRNAAFRPSAKLDVSTRSDNIAAVLASRGGKPMTEAELIAEGIILPVSEDDPDR